MPQHAPPGPLVAWDVDHTLLVTGEAGSSIMDVAVARTLARTVEHAVRYSGKTDARIATEILLAAGVPPPHDTHVAGVLAHLEDVLAERSHLLAEQGHLLPGVLDVLRRLHDAGALQTVLTGNIRPNALVKLAAFGLDAYVDASVGAFGSDDPDRRALLPLVLDRAERAYGRRWTPEQTWVVGDTEHDYACAAAGGARCLLVATGRTPYDQLAGFGADAVLADLADVDRVVALLTGSGVSSAAPRPRR